MGSSCCKSKDTDATNAVNISEMNQKEFIYTLQNDDCSILVSSYMKELNYNVKYRKSNNKRKDSKK